MNSETHPHFDIAWRELLARLPDNLDLDQSAREHGALERRRVVRDGATMLRLALAYGPSGMSLRSAAAWAAGCDIVHLTDVGLLKRLWIVGHCDPSQFIGCFRCFLTGINPSGISDE